MVYNSSYRYIKICDSNYLFLYVFRTGVTFGIDYFFPFVVSSLILLNLLKHLVISLDKHISGLSPILLICILNGEAIWLE